MVTITGGWHVRYGFGVPKKTIRRMPMSFVIVLPEETEVPAEKADQQMDVDLPEIPLIPGDFAWMVPYEDIEKDKVRMGVSLAEEDGKVLVEKVADGSPAAKAGIPAGSIIVSFDGHPVADMTDIFYLVGAKREGDKAVVVARRDGADQTFELTFFKMPKAKAH